MCICHNPLNLFPDSSDIVSNDSFLTLSKLFKSLYFRISLDCIGESVTVRILVVESSAGPTNEISEMLKDSGHTVVCSGDVKQAITEVNKSEQFNLIISDLTFPDLDGFHLLQFLKSQAASCNIPVIIATQINDKETVLKCRQLGARDYIVKPVERKLLLKRIELLMKRRKAAVLVVDDDELILGLLSKVLERQGHRVATAKTGELALETIEQDNVAIVISDIEMPGMDGLKLLAAIKEKHPQLPVFMVTGRGGKYSKEYILRTGANGYITKPFKSFEILEAVTNGLNPPHTNQHD